MVFTIEMAHCDLFTSPSMGYDMGHRLRVTHILRTCSLLANTMAPRESRTQEQYDGLRHLQSGNHKACEVLWMRLKKSHSEFNLVEIGLDLFEIIYS